MLCSRALLFLSVFSVAFCELYIVHGDGKSLPRIRLTGRDGTRDKRQATRMPIRIQPFYDTTVAQLDSSKRNMIEMDIIPDLITFLSQVLSVTRSSSPILINNQCNTRTFFIDGEGRVICPNQCLASSKCGVYTVPVSHLKQCLQCNGVAINMCSPTAGTPSQDGAGVSNTDFVLYISANQSACPSVPDTGPTTVAFATHCQLEDSIDRPVAGSVNFCPEGIARNVDGLQYIAAVTKHELLHALGFSSSLFPYWHDSNGDPRTPRTGQQLPTAAAATTIQTFTHETWQTRTGRISHTVTTLVTPAVVEAARMHFGCNVLARVELENQGGAGTAMDHWEKRILGNEAMTGVFTFNPVFSNITLAALYDTGWYDVDFSMAEELVWGRGKGCGFVQQSCGQMITTQLESGVSALFPFCNKADRFGCTVDRLSIAQCNLISTTPPNTYIAEYQYFADVSSRGKLEVADFCPYYETVTLNSRSPVCSDSANAPSTNNFLEQYGSSSRCFTHGRQWVVARRSAPFSGGGCYQYSCSRSSGVTIAINGESYTCSCTGEEVIIDTMVNGIRHFGSIVCPACEDVCHDSLDQCPPTAADVCYGQVVSLNGTILENVTYPPTSSALKPLFLMSSLWMIMISIIIFYLQ